MRIAFFGYQEPGYVSLKTLIDSKEDVLLVVSHKDNHKESIWFHSVEALASSYRIPVYFAEEIGWDSIKEKVIKSGPAIVLSVYYRLIIPEDILKVPTFGAVNLHGSLLPKYRGRAPINWAILKGEKATGFTFHFMERQPDSGDIILQRRIPVGADDEVLDIYKKMCKKIPSALKMLLKMLEEGRICRIKQDEEEASYFGLRTPEDGRIDWSWPAYEIKNLVRAVARPWPGAYTNLRGRKVYIWKAGVKDGPRVKDLPIGGVASFSSEEGLCILCGDGILCCKELQLEGERSMKGMDFTKRYGLTRLDRFE